jgi:hypothetical protein
MSKKFLTLMWRGLDYTDGGRYGDKWFWRVTVGFGYYRLVVNYFGLFIQYPIKGLITGREILRWR